MKATNGDTHLAVTTSTGSSTDRRGIQEERRRGPVEGPHGGAAPQEAAERPRFSTVLETDISLPFVTADATGPKHLQLKLTRAKFEQLAGDLERSMGPVRQALADAGLKPSDIDEVVLVGARRACRRSSSS